jgi:hypothetical protein
LIEGVARIKSKKENLEEKVSNQEWSTIERNGVQECCYYLLVMRSGSDPRLRNCHNTVVTFLR